MGSLYIRQRLSMVTVNLPPPDILTLQASSGCDDCVDMLIQHHADPTAK